MTVGIQAKFTKQPAEVVPLVFDLSGVFEDRDDLPVSAVVDVPGVDVVSTALVGLELRIVIDGGSDDVDYHGTALVSTTAGMVEEIDFTVRVRATPSTASGVPGPVAPADVEAAAARAVLARQDSEAARNEAQAARDASEAARQASEAARQGSATARQGAEAARDAAILARDGAVAARQGAEAASSNAAAAVNAAQDAAASRAAAEIAAAASLTHSQTSAQHALEAAQDVQDVRDDFASTAAGKGSALLGYLPGGDDAVGMAAQDKLREEISVLDFLTPEQRMNTYLRLATIDCGPQLQKAINAAAGKRLKWPAGYVFGCSRELIVRAPQVWAGGGKGRMLTPFGTYNRSITELRTLGDGTAYKTVKTRVKYRGSASDPKDSPISALVSIQSQGVEIRDMVIRCSYADQIYTDGTHLGDNWDVGVFVGCRLHFKMHSVAVIGCWREASIWCDVTRYAWVPEHIGWDGVRHPGSTEDGPQGGGDGCTLSEVITWGGKWGVKVKGADPKPGLIGYGADYAVSLTATLNALPADGDTLTLGGVIFTFREAPSAITDVQIEATTADTVFGLAEACVAYFDTDAVSSAFRLAIYQADGNILRTYERNANENSLTTVSYANTFTASTVSGGRITLSGTTPTTIADPAPYYDDEAGPVADSRGGYGFSDFTIRDSQIFGSSHPTGYQRQSITASTRVSLYTGVTVRDWIGDTAGGALWVDGLAANAVRMIQGHRYFNVRFDARYDPFCVRLGRTHRDEFFACHWDGASGIRAGTKTPAGVEISVLDSVRLHKYGPITRVPYLTRRTRFHGARDSTPFLDYCTLDDAGSGNSLDGAGRAEFTGAVTISGGGSLTVDRSARANGTAIARMKAGSVGSARYDFLSPSGIFGGLRYYVSTSNIRLATSGDVNTVLWKYDSATDTATQWMTPLAATGTGVYASQGHVKLASWSTSTTATIGVGASDKVVVSNTEARFADGKIRLGSAAGPMIISGSNSPEGAVTAPPGSIYLRTDGAVGSFGYRKNSGVGNVNWAAIW